MATDLHKKSVSKTDVFVEDQLARAQRKIRTTDLAQILLLLGITTLGYFLLSALVDVLGGTPPAGWLATAHWIGFAGYLGLVGLFGGLIVVQLLRRINPRFAARELERQIPDAKNSVVNWLDLREEPIAPAIRNALGSRAARDLKRTEVEKVADPRRNYLLSVIAGVLFLGLLILFLRAPHQFGSLFQRAFLPFQDATLSTRTVIELLTPPEGNASVLPGQRVEIRARLSGRVPRVNAPDAPSLLFRYHPTEAFARLPLEEDADGSWQYSLLKDQVQNGLWYKLTAGDAETPEYEIRIRTLPQVSKFDATYHFRPYLVRNDETVTFPNQEFVTPRIKGTPGTEVTLTLHANRPIRQGAVYFHQGTKSDKVEGILLPDNPQAFQVQVILDKPGSFSVDFKTSEGESNTDRGSYPVEIIPDLAPLVQLIKPGQDVDLPANGTLWLEGSASDDFGLKSLTLKVKPEGSKATPWPLPFREGKSFRFENGSFPDFLEYKDFLALEKVRWADGTNPSPGQVLEYWLEAVDNCDYPTLAGNLGKSAVFKIRIIQPEDPQKQKQERQEAEKKKQEHQKKQDQDHRQENQARKDPEQAKKDLDQKREDLQKEAQKFEDLKKQAEEQKKQEGKPGSAKGSDNQEKAKDQKPGDQPETGSQAKDSGSKDEKQAGNEPGKDSKSPGEAKNQGDQKPDHAAKGQQQEEPGNKQDSGKGQAKDAAGQPDQKPSQAKDSGQKQEANPSAKGQGQDKQDPKAGSQAKDSGKQDPGAQAKADGKDSQGPSPKQDSQKGQAKDAPGQKQEGPGQAKDQGAPKNPSDKTDTGKAKDQQPGQEGKGAQAKTQGDDTGTPPGKEKNGGKGTPGEDQKLGQSKDPGQKSPPQPQSKPGSPDEKVGENTDLAQPKSNPKPDEKQAQNKPGSQGGGPSPGAAKKNDQTPEAGQAKGSGEQAQQARPDSKSTGEEKTPTMEDLKQWADQIRKQSPDSDQALKDLSQAAEKSPPGSEVQQSAEKMMKELQDQGLVKPGPSTQDPKKQPGDLAQGTGQKPGASQEKGKPGKKPEPQTGPGGQGIPDQAKAQDPNEDFARRLQNLQLQKWKDAVTPEMLKQQGITEADWQKFQKAAREYENLLSRLKAKTPSSTTGELRGQTSQLPGQGPTQLQKGPQGALDPLSSGRGVVPPHLREEYQRWTTGNKKK